MNDAAEATPETPSTLDAGLWVGEGVTLPVKIWIYRDAGTGMVRAVSPKRADPDAAPAEDDGLAGARQALQEGRVSESALAAVFEVPGPDRISELRARVRAALRRQEERPEGRRVEYDDLMRRLVVRHQLRELDATFQGKPLDLKIEDGVVAEDVETLLFGRLHPAILIGLVLTFATEAGIAF